MDYNIGFLNYHCMSHSNWVPDELTLIPLLPTNSYDENAESEDFVNIDDIRNVEIKREVKEEEDSVTENNDVGFHEYCLISSSSWIPQEKILQLPSPLTHHMNTHPVDKEVQCDLCKRCFANKKILQKHALIHNIKTQFECQISGKEFAYNNHLKSLQRQIEKTIECPACDHMFYTVLQRTQHMRKIHKDFKPFLCIICDERFLNRKKLNNHKKTHGRRPYTCETCGGKYKYKYLLLRHSHIHTGKQVYKPFQCDKCGRQFDRDIQFKKHFLKFHSTRKNPIQCKICNEPFIDRRALSRHVKRIHVDIVL